MNLFGWYLSGEKSKLYLIYNIFFAKKKKYIYICIYIYISHLYIYICIIFLICICIYIIYIYIYAYVYRQILCGVSSRRKVWEGLDRFSNCFFFNFVGSDEVPRCVCCMCGACIFEACWILSHIRGHDLEIPGTVRGSGNHSIFNVHSDRTYLTVPYQHFLLSSTFIHWVIPR